VPAGTLHAAWQVSEAAPLIEEQEAERYVNAESVTREAISAVEQDGAAREGGGCLGWGAVWGRVRPGLQVHDVMDSCALFLFLYIALCFRVGCAVLDSADAERYDGAGFG